MHLTEAELVDLADGTLSEVESPRVEAHLMSCVACRQQLAELRATLASVAEVDVPEPSPLFWDHFSRRVHEAVAAQGGRRSWLPWFLPAAAMVCLMLVVFAPGVWRSMRPAAGDVAVMVPLPARETLADVTDPSMSLMADLTDGIGWDDAHEAGLAPRGSAEHAVTHLNDAELRELQRLLKVELAHASD